MSVGITEARSGVWLLGAQTWYFLCLLSSPSDLLFGLLVTDDFSSDIYYSGPQEQGAHLLNSPFHTQSQQTMALSAQTEVVVYELVRLQFYRGNRRGIQRLKLREVT